MNSSSPHHHHQAHQELRSLYQQKGFSGTQLDSIVATIEDNKHLFINETLQAQGYVANHSHPLGVSLVTFFSFILIGLMPILPVIIFPQTNFVSILIFVAFILFLVGTLRAKFMSVPWWRGGIEIMLAGVTGSLIAYLIGDLLSGILLQ